MCRRQIVWILAFLAATSSDNESELYCIPLVEATYYHPSDVTDWSCEYGVGFPGVHIPPVRRDALCMSSFGVHTQIDRHTSTG